MDKKNTFKPRNPNDIDPLERKLIDKSIDSAMSLDDLALEKAALDATDLDHDPLNDKANDNLGSDLDLPGTELDDEDEAIGEEDEENNLWSQADTE